MQVSESVGTVAPLVMDGCARLSCGGRHASPIPLKALDQPIRLRAVEVGLCKASPGVSDTALNGLVGDNANVPA